MHRVVVVVALLAVALVVGAQDKDKDKDKGKDDPKVKGFLPANFKKLGLSDKQKQDIYKIQSGTKAKLDELDKQKAKLKADEKAAIEKVLTPEQIKELERIRTGKDGEKDKNEKDKNEKDKNEKDK